MEQAQLAKQPESKQTYEAEIYNEALPESQREGFSPIYRQKGRKELISTPNPQIRTVRDIVRQCKNLYGSRPGIGQIIVQNHSEDGKTYEKRLVKQHTYKQLYEEALSLGKAMVERQLYFMESERAMKLIGVYSRNRLEWFLTDWACSLFGLTTVPLYDTLGRDNLTYCLQTTGLTSIFVSSKTATQLSKFQSTGALRTIIAYDTIDQETTTKLQKLGLKVVTYECLIEAGRKSKVNEDDVEVTPQTIYSFCYTSGTTGVPKGALISHENLLAALSTFILHKDLAFCAEDRYLSYLPLPHLMERTIANCMFFAGAFLVVSCGNPAKIKEDSAAIKATIFISVPRVFNRIVDSVNSLLASAKVEEGQLKGFEEELYRKIREGYGGCVRVMAGGSAPLTAKVQETMQNIMGCPLIEGYGQTEATCAVVFSRKTTFDFAKMHELSPAVEVKLCDIPEMKYTSKDIDDDGRPTPRGQIWTRGPQVFKGYYKREEANQETMTADGWVRSGDVGEMTPGLALRVIDRKKNIFKLQQGEYVAPDRVERIYLKSGLVEEVFLHGTSTNSFAVAIAFPSREQLSLIATSMNMEGPFEQQCSSRQVRRALLEKLNGGARAQGLHGFELAKNISLVSQGFAGRGILTNTMKLMRYEARTCFKGEIESMYQEGPLEQ